ncbi:MAG: aspartate ammonia-lyase [Planctomycetota bacterium]
MRTEHDALGSLQVPADCLHGIHTARASSHFRIAGRPVAADLIHAYGAVKMACCRINARLGHLDQTTAGAIEAACEEMRAGALDAHIVVDALQGGAGTSLNMNINEVLANRALQILGHAPGAYAHCDPLEQVNRHQSTNDTFPTALRVAAMQVLKRLEQGCIALLEACQDRERALAAVVCVGRTQLQDAVLLTLGRQFGAYADALARDRWRVHKCEERLRVVNLGGTAVGTGLGAPRQFIFQVVDELRAITGLPLARAENLVDATANQDALVEVAGVMNALATTLIKMAGDLRLLASGPAGGFGEIVLPARQAGSSIMPDKINPVIPEAVQQAGMRSIAAQQCIAQAVAAGSLQINPFLPLVADELLGSLDQLDRACRMLAEHCVAGIASVPERCAANVAGSTALLTALVDRVGYHQASEWAAQAQQEGRPVREVVLDSGRISAPDLAACTSPEAVNRLGSLPPREDQP